MVESDLWQWLSKQLIAGNPALLAVVVEHRGSSPGRTGAKLALALDGTVGSVGGGAVEHRVIETARSMLTKGESTPHRMIFQHRLNPDQAHIASGMLCGGGQTVMLMPLTNADQSICAVLAQGQTGWLCLSDHGMVWRTSNAPSDSDTVSWHYRERYPKQPRAYLVGGGHVNLALSQVLAQLDFDVTVLEQRPDLTTLSANHYAHRIHLVDYYAIADAIPEGDDVYTLIATHSHHWDACVVRQLLSKQLRYLGAIGSADKANHLHILLSPDFPEERLAILRLPAGLPINSHTPAEIAVSIAAEMVGIKNKRHFLYAAS